MSQPASHPRSIQLDSLRRALRAHPVAWLGGGVVLLLGILLGPGFAFGPKVAVETVVRQDFLQTLVASGRVETPHRVDVGVRVTGIVDRVLVQEGDKVAPGTILLTLEASEPRAALRQAEQSERAALARVRQLREVQAPLAGVERQRAQLALDAARDVRRRSQSLYAAGAISAAARDDARRAEEAAAAQLRSAEQLAATAQPSGAESATAAAGLEQARAGVAIARAKLAYATVTTPSAGTVIMREVEPGDLVQPGRTVMVISPDEDAQLVLAVDEKHLQRLTPGLPALASADAYPAERFAAEVASVSPSVDAQRGTVTVKLRVPAPPAYLQQDMSVSVDIETARRTRAVLVPCEAVHALESAAPWVLKVQGGRARRQPVTIGLQSEGLCEVLSGVSDGDRVVPAGTTGIADGSRLRPIAAP